MSWADVCGHERVIHAFEQAWKKGRLGHAYLFVGPPGIGKMTFALELARALLCENRKDQLVACGQCGECALVRSRTHPDLILAARPEEAVDLPIDLIRELIEQLALKPARGDRKVAILDDADDLTAEAANAFLKTLEEPPPGSLLVLIGGAAADRQYSTILSRCQTVQFHALPGEVVAAHLRTQGIDDPLVIDRLVRVGAGSIGQAVALNDQSLWEFRKVLLDALAAPTVDAFSLASRWNAYVEDAGKEAGVRRRRASLVLRLFIGLLQDAVRLAHGLAPLVADAEESATLEALVQRTGMDQLLSWIDRAAEADLQVDRKVQLELLIEAFADSLAQ